MEKFGTIWNFFGIFWNFWNFWKKIIFQNYKIHPFRKYIFMPIMEGNKQVICIDEHASYAML
jgi:hypothetical protein